MKKLLEHHSCHMLHKPQFPSVLFIAIVFFNLHPRSFAVEAPKLVQKDGHYALMVDGRPYLILGGRFITPARGRSNCNRCGNRWQHCTPTQ